MVSWKKRYFGVMFYPGNAGKPPIHYNDVIMSGMTSQITSPTTGYSTKKTSKLCATGLCEGNSPVTGEFPAQRASNAEKASIWWRHHDVARSHHRSNIQDKVKFKAVQSTSCSLTSVIATRLTMMAQFTDTCRQTSNTSRTKSQNWNVSRLVLQVSLPNPLKPGGNSRMKM